MAIFIITYFLIIVVSIFLLPFINVLWKGRITVITVIFLAIISGIPAMNALSGINTELVFPGSIVTGEIPLRIDSLSGWFILLINFTFITGILYGSKYLQAYKKQKDNLSVHYTAYILVNAAMIAVCSVQNSIVFLIAWEIMALASFILIIFEHYKNDTLKAGINFLVQSHICILFLTLAFIWVAVKTHSYDFNAIVLFSRTNTSYISMGLFFCFFFGFAIKAGFVPFHTWLPHAHPAAPSHVSGVMSGVIIKIGIFGILRMILLIKIDYFSIGIIILIVSVISGIYGVMLAIIQHNLKKLLAYHSIENIGIIGIGIGIGCIGMSLGNEMLIMCGFAGALLHTLNHSLFKSLLFYSAGNIYQSVRIINIDHLGGLIKRMPHTAFLFLMAALAICGLPPFNGFVSEFLIYTGMLHGLSTSSLGFVLILIFSVFGLALIGGLALLCFTKAFGIVFLGTTRNVNVEVEEASWGKLLPMYAIVLLILLIGVYPGYFVKALMHPVGLYANNINFVEPVATFSALNTINIIGICSLGFILFTALLLFIRKKITEKRYQHSDNTWGCGYVAPNIKMQYTASSFVRTYRKLAEPIFSLDKKKQDISGVFPKHGKHEIHTYDKAEKFLIDKPLKSLKTFFNLFAFLQNGKLQFYILYGVVFISSIIGLPVIYSKLKLFIQFLLSI